MKKIALFIDKNLVKELGQYTQAPIIVSVWGTAYQAALEFYTQVVRLGTDPHFRRIREPQNIQEMHLSGSAEAGWLKRTFTDSVRVEVYIALGVYSTIKLEIRGYKKGEKKASDAFCFYFKPDGSSAGAGYSSHR